MDKRTIVSSLAMDLKRTAISLHRKSFSTANIFTKEAFKRGEELESINSDEYLSKIWSKTKHILQQSEDRTAEDLLMYSTLFQNFAIKKL